MFANYHGYDNYKDDVLEGFTAPYWWGTGGNWRGQLDAGIWYPCGGVHGLGVFYNDCANGSCIRYCSTQQVMSVA